MTGWKSRRVAAPLVALALCAVAFAALHRLAELEDAQPGASGPGQGSSLPAARTSASSSNPALLAAPVNATHGFVVDDWRQEHGLTAFVAIGDVTGDGRDDLVTTSQASYEPAVVNIYRQIPGAPLADPVRYAAPGDRYAGGFSTLVLMDLNEDGRKDVVLSRGVKGEIWWLLSNEDGGFDWRVDRWTTQTVATYRMSPGDVDQDGHADLTVFRNSFPGAPQAQLHTYFGDGKGGFGRHRAAGAHEPAISDLATIEGDATGQPGLLTIVPWTGDRGGDGINWHAYEPGRFGDNVRIVDTNRDMMGSIAAGDVNGDGRADIVAENRNSMPSVRDHVLIYRRAADGTFDVVPERKWGGFSGSKEPWAMQVTDLNGDGFGDAIWGIGGWPRLYYMLGGPEQMGDVVQVDLPVNVDRAHDSIATGDLDGDGLADVAIAAEAYGVLLLRSTLTPYTGNASAPGAPTIGTAAVDPATVQNTNADNLRVSVTFTPPASNGGAPITGYVVRSVPGGAYDEQRGQTGTTHRIAHLNDGVDYRFYVTATNAAGTGVASGLSNLVEVRDSPQYMFAPIYSLQEFPFEGDGPGGFVDIAVLLNGPAASDVTFDIETVAGAAQPGVDYVHTALAGQRIRKGDSQYVFRVPLIGDLVPEDNESFDVKITSTGGLPPTTSVVTNYIKDDDNLPVLSLSSTAVTEGDAGTANATIVASLSRASPFDVTFQVGTVDDGGTATPVGDYVPRIASSLRILAGKLQASVVFQVVGDRRYEPAESVQVAASYIDNAKIGGAGTITINDDDIAAGISVDDVQVDEGTGGQRSANFVVRLSQPQPVPVSFDAFTEPGTASPGADYADVWRLATVIPAGATSATVSVPIVSDASVEGQETFSLTLANVAGVAVTDGQGLATILNDDMASIIIDDLVVQEGEAPGRTVYMRVHLSEAMPTPVSFDIAPDLMYPYDIAYRARYYDVTIDPGRTDYLYPITIVGNSQPQPDQTFHIVVRNVWNAIPTRGGMGEGRIIDDDAATSPAPTTAGTTVGTSVGTSVRVPPGRARVRAAAAAGY